MLLFTDGFTNFSQFGCQFGGFSGFLHFLVPLSRHVFVICDKDVELIGTWIKPLGVNTYQSQSCFSRTSRQPPSTYHTKLHDWWWRLLFFSWLAHWFSLWSSENKCVLALRVLWRAGWHRRVWASSNCPHKGGCKQSQVAHSGEIVGELYSFTSTAVCGSLWKRRGGRKKS